jgi:solute carrier family 50 protein (sugar transporter)
MLAPSIIILEYVCPILGMIAANFMFAAPLKSVRKAISLGTLGSLNPTPWAFMTGNCIGWVTYSYLINNVFLLLANVPGLILSVWLNMAAAKLQYCDRISQSMRSSFVQLLDANRKSFRISREERIALGNHSDEDEDGEQDETLENTTTMQQQQQQQPPPTSPKQQRPTLTNDIHTFTNLRKMALDITIQKSSIPAPHEKVVVSIVAFWIALISILYFLQLTIDQWKLIIGFIVNINLLFFYGAPLSTIYTVLSTKDSSSIHRPTMLLNTANAVFWTAFGFGVLDWFIIVPNGLGAILGFVQMVLRMVVPSRDLFASSSSLNAATAAATVAVVTKTDLELGVDSLTSTPSSPSVGVDDSC